MTEILRNLGDSCGYEPLIRHLTTALVVALAADTLIALLLLRAWQRRGAGR